MGACARPSVAAGGGLPWPAGGTGLPRLSRLSWAAGAEGLPWASATLMGVVSTVTAAASTASHVTIPGAAPPPTPHSAKAPCMFASSPKRAPDPTLTKVNGDRIDRDCPGRSHFADFGQVGANCRRDLTYK